MIWASKMLCHSWCLEKKMLFFCILTFVLNLLQVKYRFLIGVMIIQNTLSVKAGWTVQLNIIIFLSPVGFISSLSTEIKISNFMEHENRREILPFFPLWASGTWVCGEHSWLAQLTVSGCEKLLQRDWWNINPGLQFTALYWPKYLSSWKSTFSAMTMSDKVNTQTGRNISGKVWWNTFKSFC